MKVVITNMSEITPQLTRVYSYSILDDKGAALLSNQSIDVMPSDALEQIKSRLDAFKAQYEVNDIQVGMEIA